VLTDGWIHRFLARDQNRIGWIKVYLQEDPRLKIPPTFLDQYLDIVQQHIIGVNSRLVYHFDETGCWDWEEGRLYDRIVLAVLKDIRINFLVTRRIKHQTMIVCSHAAWETLCLLIVTTDRLINQSLFGVFRDGIEENIDLKVHVRHTAYVDAIVFHPYLRDVLIPRIEKCRKANESPKSQTISSWITVRVIWQERSSISSHHTRQKSSHSHLTRPISAKCLICHSSMSFKLMRNVFRKSHRCLLCRIIRCACSCHARRLGRVEWSRCTLLGEDLFITKIQEVDTPSASMRAEFGTRQHFAKFGISFSDWKGVLRDDVSPNVVSWIRRPLKAQETRFLHVSHCLKGITHDQEWLKSPKWMRSQMDFWNSINEVWIKKFIFRSARSREQLRLRPCKIEMHENTVVITGLRIDCTAISFSELDLIQFIYEYID
jgi:hypothetical protein